jgi:hypothetical protein
MDPLNCILGYIETVGVHAPVPKGFNQESHRTARIKDRGRTDLVHYSLGYRSKESQPLVVPLIRATAVVSVVKRVVRL